MTAFNARELAAGLWQLGLDRLGVQLAVLRRPSTPVGVHPSRWEGDAEYRERVVAALEAAGPERAASLIGREFVAQVEIAMDAVDQGDTRGHELLGPAIAAVKAHATAQAIQSAHLYDQPPGTVEEWVRLLREQEPAERGGVGLADGMDAVISGTIGIPLRAWRILKDVWPSTFDAEYERALLAWAAEERAAGH